MDDPVYKTKFKILCIVNDLIWVVCKFGGLGWVGQLLWKLV